MKSTNAISELISELSIISFVKNNPEPHLGPEHAHVSISSLIALFEKAKQDESKGIAEWLLSAAGYGWIVHLVTDEVVAIPELCDFTRDKLFRVPEVPMSQTPAIFSEAQFMKLIPINAHLH